MPFCVIRSSLCIDHVNWRRTPTHRPISKASSRACATPPADLIAALHVFLSARRNLVVREVVRPFANEHLRDVEPVSGDFRPRDLDALLVFALVIARLLSRHHQLDDARLTAISLDFAAHMIAAHTENVARDEVPPVIIPRSHLHDPVRQALHEAAFIVVGRSGVDHATLSRIDRLALCEVGTAHDLYGTRDELIADAYRHSYTDYWMRLNNFVNVLEPGYLATLFEAAINEADPDRRAFIIEFTLAFGHHDVLAGAANELITELESITEELDTITPDEVILLQAMIRILSYAMFGISMIEALCGSLTWEQLVPLGESIRLGILATHEKTWASLRDKLRRYYLTQVS